jgi:hypothetical protein
VVSYRNFYGAFSKCYNNFKLAYIFDNPAFCIGPEFTDTITEGFFGRAFYNTHTIRIRTLRYCDCFINENFKDVNAFAADGLPFPVATWMRLRACLLRSRNVLTSNVNLNLTKNIEEFLSIPTKGSKRFRKFFDRVDSANAVIENLRSTQTFYGLIDLPVRNTIISCNTLWTKSFISNDFRDFLFKCRYNYLPLNNRRAAYDPDANPHCSFCRIQDPDTDTRESFAHIFFSCPTTIELIRNLLRFFVTAPDDNLSIKKLVWNGELAGADNIQFILLFFWDSFRYTVYRYKVSRRIPNFLMVKKEIFFIIKTTLYNKNNFRNIIDNTRELANWLPALG